MFTLKGIYAPIPTPFIEGKIAYKELNRNLDFWLQSKLEGIVLMGSNGEFTLLNPEEKDYLMSFICTKAKGKKPIIIGTGAESTTETIRLSRVASECGANAVLVITPNYYKGSMTDKALKTFYKDVADNSPIPVILYNMPRNTGINLSSKIVSELSHHPNIIGIKDSGGNIVQISEIINSTPDGFAVFAGSASYLYTSLALGATGGTLALANILPNECVQILELFQEGKYAEARAVQMKLMEINAAVTSRWGVAGLKAAMNLLGLFGGEPRLPLLPLEDSAKEELKTILDKFRAQ